MTTAPHDPPPRPVLSDADVPTAGRRRQYSWSDPLTTARAAAGRSGLQLLTAMRDGDLPEPPIAATLGMSGLQVEDGWVVFTLEPQEWHYNPIGSVHGGVHATLLDSAMGCAVHTRLPAGTGYTTLDLSVRYLRPVRADSGVLRCEGRVVSLGSRVATATGEITDPNGRVVATGTTACLLWALTDGTSS